MEGNKKESVFKKIENNILLQVVFFVVSMAVIVGGYVGLSEHAKKVGNEKAIRDAKLTTDYDILMSAENVSTEDGVMTFSGWAMRLDSVTKNVHLVLKEVDGTGQIVLKTEAMEREEIEEYFKPGWEFGEVGFETTIKGEKIKKDTCYEVLLHLTYETEQEKEEGNYVLVEEEKKIASGKYLYNGDLYRYNPKTFVEPELDDEELKQVIDEGILRVVDLENKIWVYQKMDLLYFIVDSDVSLKNSGMRIPVMSQTYRKELLPEHRKQYGFDHLGEFYENEEYIKRGVTSYQIAKINLSDEYPTTYVVIGLFHSDSDTWKKRFEVFLADDLFEKDR